MQERNEGSADEAPRLPSDLPPLPSRFFRPRPRLACPQCDRTFATAEQLNEHARRAHHAEGRGGDAHPGDTRHGDAHHGDAHYGDARGHDGRGGHGHGGHGERRT